jgi:hypothetical protein
VALCGELRKAGCGLLEIGFILHHWFWVVESEVGLCCSLLRCAELKGPTGHNFDDGS